MRPSLPTLVILLLVMLFAPITPSAGALRSSSLDTLVPNPLVLETPHVRQKPDYCGEAVYSMAFQYYGRNVSQDDVHQAGCAQQTRGCYSNELLNAAGRLGLPTVERRWNIGPSRAWPTDLLNSAFAQLMSELRLGKPVMFGWYGSDHISPSYLGHFMLLVGFDETRRVVYYHDPGSSTGPDEMSYETFLHYWPMPTVNFSSWLLLAHIFGNGKSPFLDVTPTSTSWLLELSDTTPHPVQLQLDSTGQSAIPWTATLGPDAQWVTWLEFEPQSGMTPGTITLVPRLTNLTAGQRSTRLWVKSGVNSIPVTVRLVTAQSIYRAFLPLMQSDAHN